MHFNQEKTQVHTVERRDHNSVSILLVNTSDKTYPSFSSVEGKFFHHIRCI